MQWTGPSVKEKFGFACWPSAAVVTPRANVAATNVCARGRTGALGSRYRMEPGGEVLVGLVAAARSGLAELPRIAVPLGKGINCRPTRR